MWQVYLVPNPLRSDTLLCNSMPLYNSLCRLFCPAHRLYGWGSPLSTAHIKTDSSPQTNWLIDEESRTSSMLSTHIFFSRVWGARKKTERQWILDLYYWGCVCLPVVNEKTVLTQTTSFRFERQCYLICGFIQKMGVNCLQWLCIVSHYKNCFITSSGTGSGSGPE